MAVAKSSQLHEEKGSGAPRGVIRPGWRGSCGAPASAGGLRAHPLPAPRRAPPVSRPPTPLVLVWLALLCAPHSCSEHDACRPAVAANRDLYLTGETFLPTFVWLAMIWLSNVYAPLPGLFTRSPCKWYAHSIRCDQFPLSISELAFKVLRESFCEIKTSDILRPTIGSDLFWRWSSFLHGVDPWAISEIRRRRFMKSRRPERRREPVVMSRRLSLRSAPAWELSSLGGRWLHQYSRMGPLCLNENCH